MKDYHTVSCSPAFISSALSLFITSRELNQTCSKFLESPSSGSCNNGAHSGYHLCFFLTLSFHSTPPSLTVFTLPTVLYLMHTAQVCHSIEQCGNLYTACCKLCAHTTTVPQVFVHSPTIVTWSREAEADSLHASATDQTSGYCPLGTTSRS